MGHKVNIEKFTDGITRFPRILNKSMATDFMFLITLEAVIFFYANKANHKYMCCIVWKSPLAINDNKKINFLIIMLLSSPRRIDNMGTLFGNKC